jgi:hypothetical protein
MLLLAVLACASLMSAMDADAQGDPYVRPFVKAERLSTNRIVNGTVAVNGSFPSVAQLLGVIPSPPGGPQRQGLMCGASIIAPRKWALTAVRCTYGGDGRPLGANDIALRVGTELLGEGGQLTRAAKIFPAPPTQVFASATETLTSLVRPPVPDRPTLGPTVVLSLASGTLRVGQDREATLVSNVPGRLLVFNQNDAGGGFLAVPNQMSRAVGRAREKLVAGGLHVIADENIDPFSLRARLPLGHNRLVAVVIPDTPSVEAAITPYLDQREITNIDTWMKRLAGGITAGRVAVGTVEYEVER